MMLAQMRRRGVPLNTDSFDVIQKILLLGSPKLLTGHQGIAALYRLRTAAVND